jgi:hypothetical protein
LDITYRSVQGAIGLGRKAERGNGEIRKVMLDNPKGEKGKGGGLGDVERGRYRFISGYID